ncbi:hypothetical protein ACH5RR_031992 [Cinchona calisaya]|uniref:Retrotransposon Copia-like N-terminal domain-containing protein n=1 Tax=Cinchona calisaya TaxID=153742 RepID=A0ABD2YK88_9GENT
MFSSSSLHYTSSPATLLTSNITYLVTKKPDSTNYVLWKSQFTSVLVGHDLLGYVDGNFHHIPKILVDATGGISLNPAYVAWIKIDQNIKSWINATLTQDVL